MPVITEEIMQQTMILQMQLKSIGDRLMTVVADAAALENDPNRPPSPPPKYDSKGIRTNTREVRMREELSKQRTEVIEELLRINPMYQVSFFTLNRNASCCGEISNVYVIMRSPRQTMFEQGHSRKYISLIKKTRPTTSLASSLGHEEIHRSAWSKRQAPK